MRCLITGVTGQDGWYLSEILLGQGHDVFGLVTPGDTAALHPGVRALPGDLRDLDSLRGAVADADPDETYNVAAIAAGDPQPLVLGDLDVRRDWGYARDYADAMVRIARHDVPLDFVIATGESHSIGEFVAAAFAHAGIEDWERHVRQDPSLLR